MDFEEDEIRKRAFVSKLACKNYIKLWRSKRSILSDTFFGVPKKVEEEKPQKKKTEKTISEMSDNEVFTEFTNRIIQMLKDPIDNLIEESYEYLLNRCADNAFKNYTNAQLSCITHAKTANEAEECLNLSKKQIKYYSEKYDSENNDL